MKNQEYVVQAESERPYISKETKSHGAGGIGKPAYFQMLKNRVRQEGKTPAQGPVPMYKDLYAFLPSSAAHRLS